MNHPQSQPPNAERRTPSADPALSAALAPVPLAPVPLAPIAPSAPVPPGAPAVLPYADLPSRWGIVLDRTPERLLIVIPLAHRWRSPEVVIPLIIAAAFFSAALYLLLVTALPRLLAGQLATTGLFIGVAAGMYLWKSRKPVIIELTSSELIFRNAPFSRHEGQSHVQRDLFLPREGIYDVKYVAHSGHLVIRIRGRELIETRPLPDPRLLQWLATELRAALSLPG